MNRLSYRRFAIGMFAAPLLLGLAACGGSKDAGEAVSGEPIAKIAPPEGKQWTDVVSTTEQGGYVMGNPDAPIKLIEFASLTCSHCAHFAEESGVELKQDFVNSGRVSYEFRNFVRDGIDLTAAQLTRCGTPESFFALTDQVFAYQAQIFEKAQSAGDAAFSAAMSQPEEKRGVALAQLTGLLDYFAARGISREQATQCLSDASQAQKLAKLTEAQGTEYSIQGTPTFLVNGQKMESSGWPEVKARLETLGAR